jgi:hypothetical protein
MRSRPPRSCRVGLGQSRCAAEPCAEARGPAAPFLRLRWGRMSPRRRRCPGRASARGPRLIRRSRRCACLRGSGPNRGPSPALPRKFLGPRRVAELQTAPRDAGTAPSSPTLRDRRHQPAPAAAARPIGPCGSGRQGAQRPARSRDSRHRPGSDHTASRSAPTTRGYERTAARGCPHERQPRRHGSAVPRSSWALAASRVEQTCSSQPPLQPRHGPLMLALRNWRS